MSDQPNPQLTIQPLTTKPRMEGKTAGLIGKSSLNPVKFTLKTAKPIVVVTPKIAGVFPYVYATEHPDTAWTGGTLEELLTYVSENYKGAQVLTRKYDPNAPTFQIAKGTPEEQAASIRALFPDSSF